MQPEYGQNTPADWSGKTEYGERYEKSAGYGVQRAYSPTKTTAHGKRIKIK